MAHFTGSRQARVISPQSWGTKPGETLETENLVGRKRVALFLAFVVVVLVLLHSVTQFAKFNAGHTRLLGLVRMFDLGNENNFATWYSSMILLLCAVLLLVIGLHVKNTRGTYAGHWLTLAGIFLLLSLDETASIHERANHLGRYFKQFNYFGGLFYQAWVAAGICFVLTIGAVYLKFIVHLPRNTRMLFVVACLLYVGGALGLEMIEGTVNLWLGGVENLPYQLLVGVEEACEMMGVVVFIYALLGYIGLYMSADKTWIIKVNANVD